MEIIHSISASLKEKETNLSVSTLSFNNLQWSFIPKEKKIIEEYLAAESKSSELINSFIRTLGESELTFHMEEEIMYDSFFKFQFHQISQEEAKIILSILFNRAFELERKNYNRLLDYNYQELVDGLHNVLSEYAIYSNCAVDLMGKLKVFDINSEFPDDANPCLTLINSDSITYIYYNNYF
jgi:hypothetical protein